MNDKDELVFEVNNYAYKKQYILFFVLSLFLFTLVYFLSNQSSNDQLAKMLAAFLFVTSTIALIGFYRKPTKIKFYTDRIYREQRVINLNLKDINEVYKVSYFYFLFLTGISKLRRLSSFSKFVIVSISFIILPFYFLIYILQWIQTKKFYFQEIIVLIGKKDEEYIYIEMPLLDSSKQEELSNYFKEKMSIDINELESKWFIPEEATTPQFIREFEK